jgi:hypothetical protein
MLIIYQGSLISAVFISLFLLAFLYDVLEIGQNDKSMSMTPSASNAPAYEKHHNCIEGINGLSLHCSLNRVTRRELVLKEFANRDLGAQNGS